MCRTSFFEIGVDGKKKVKSRFLIFIALILLAVSNAAGADASVNPVSTISAGDSKSSGELVISIQDRKLALLADGKAVKVYSIAVGAPETPSPIGQFKIINRLVKPTYYHKGLVIKPGRANPLGNRWMGLDLKGFGIHGTNEPRSIGHAASHGCIRMGKKDLEDLFRQVHVGDEVTIYSELPANLASVFEPRKANDTEAKAASKSEQELPPPRSETAGSL